MGSGALWREHQQTTVSSRTLIAALTLRNKDMDKRKVKLATDKKVGELGRPFRKRGVIVGPCIKPTSALLRRAAPRFWLGWWGCMHQLVSYTAIADSPLYFLIIYRFEKQE